MKANVKLGPIEERYLDRIRTWRNDPRIYKWSRQCEPLTKAQHEGWFKGLHGRQDVKMYSILDDSDQCVGVCGLTGIDWVNSRAEFSIYVAPDQQGQGYGEAALRSLVDFGFNVLNLNCIWGESFNGNPAREMFKKVGFTDEGCRRQFYFKHGEYIASHIFSLLRHEWNG